MYNISADAIALFNSNARQIAKLTIFGAQETLVITEANIIQGSLSVDRYSVSNEQIELGSAIAAQLDFKLDNRDGDYDDFTFEGSEVYAEIGVKDWYSTDLNEPTYWVPLGYFLVDTPPRKLNTISISALDRMVLFNKTVNPASLSFPMTVQQLVTACCSLCNVTSDVVFTGLPNASYSITKLPDEEDLTYRSLIQWCAALLGTCAYIKYNGHLDMKWYSSTGISISPSTRYSSDLYENDIEITGIAFTDADGAQHYAGTLDYAIDLSGNLLLQGSVDTVLTAIEQKINTNSNNFAYRPYEAKTKPMPYMWPMDQITFVDKENNSYSTIITNVNFTMNGATYLFGRGKTTQISKYAGGNGLTAQQSRVIEKVKENIDVQLSVQEQTTMSLNQTIASSMGLNMFTQTAPNGGTLYYFGDGTTLADSTIIYTFGTNGFAWTNDWNDGNPIWNYGIDADGNQVIKTLQAEGINADWINTGALTVKDANNHILFKADATNRTAQLAGMSASYDADEAKMLLDGDVIISTTGEITLASGSYNGNPRYRMYIEGGRLYMEDRAFSGDYNFINHEYVAPGLANSVHYINNGALANYSVEPRIEFDGRGVVITQNTPLQVKSSRVDFTGQVLCEDELYLIDSNTPVNVLSTLNGKLTVGIAIPTGANLNNYTDNQRAYCSSNSTASSGTNFPVAKAGFLDVQTTGNTVFQTYQTYDNSGTYTRYRYSGSWSSWQLAPGLVVPSSANNVALLDANGYVVDSGKALTPAGIGAVSVSGASSGNTAAISTNYSAPTPQRVRIQATVAGTGGGDYSLIATDNGVLLWDWGTNQSVWSSKQTDVVHKLNKSVSGTTSSSNSYISLGLNADYGVLAVRDTQATHICIPYWSTASNGWYARVLTTAMANANSAAVTLDVDYYSK